jgi:hypothetical protein
MCPLTIAPHGNLRQHLDCRFPDPAATSLALSLRSLMVVRYRR